jgi:hypothetical protein
MMKKNKMIGILISIAITMFTLPSLAAEYMCKARLSPGSGSNGDYGYIVYTTTTLPRCAGTTVKGTAIICSTGATSSSCPSSSINHHRSDQLIALYHTLVDAAESELRVESFVTSCNGGASGCVAYVGIRAD